VNYSLAFTSYKSFKYIKKQLELDYFNLSDNRIDEIVIQDDCSSDYSLIQPYANERIKVFQNAENLSPLLNRVKLVENCKNNMVLLMDSDNFLDIDSFSKINNCEYKDNVIYCPDYAKPAFKFKEFSNLEINFSFAKEQINTLGMQIFLNNGNYFVPKKAYLEVAKNIDVKFAHFAVDVIYFNYLWLKEAGNKLKCVKDYEYDHTLRSDGYYSINENPRTQKKLMEVIELYLNL
jgi:hypothetical protein